MTQEDLEYMVLRHDTDLYRGRGKNDPPITGRLLLLENAVERFAKNSSKLVWLVLGTLLVGVANLIFHSIGK
jgi:hypothetical protein